MWKPVAGNFYGLFGAGINGIDDLEIVDGGHLPFIQSCAGFVLSFVGTPLVPNRSCPIPIFLYNKDKLVFSLLDGGRFV